MEINTINRKIKNILTKLKELKEYLEKYEIEKNEPIKKAYYLSSQKLVEEIVESAIKINIIIIKEKNEIAKSYYHSFIELNKIIKLENYKELADSAKFRNKLAHEYDEIKEEEFIEKANKIIKIYPNYIKTLKNNIQ